MIFNLVPLNDKKISKIIIFPGLKGNAFVYENILKEHVKSKIYINCSADDNISVQNDGSTDHAVKKNQFGAQSKPDETHELDRATSHDS